MTDRVKLIWDFRGPSAAQIAAHHVKHLEEFVLSEGIKDTICQTEGVNSMYHMACLIVGREHMNVLRERLNPHRGQNYTEI